MIASVKDDGMVLVEGEEVGHLDGFTFHPTVADGEDKAPILATKDAASLKKLNGVYVRLWHRRTRAFPARH